MPPAASRSAPQRSTRSAQPASGWSGWRSLPQTWNGPRPRQLPRRNPRSSRSARGLCSAPRPSTCRYDHPGGLSEPRLPGNLAVIQHETHPCWAIQWFGEHRPAGDGPHLTRAEASEADQDLAGARHKNCGGQVAFGTDAWCPSCEAEGLSDEDWELVPFRYAQLSYHCLTVSCDCGGNCGGCCPCRVAAPAFLADPDREIALHLPAWNDILAAAGCYDWDVTSDGYACAPGCVLPPGAGAGAGAAAPLPGQLVFPQRAVVISAS